MTAHNLSSLMRSKPDWRSDDGSAEFWSPESFASGIAWAGRYSGDSPCERHPDCDEFLYVVDGDVTVTILDDVQERRVSMSAGSFLVVPRGLWHRQSATGVVTQIGATPGRTDISDSDDPREG